MASSTDKSLNVFFLTLVPFPYGLAQTNRLIAITRGLFHSGTNVKVICLKPTEATGLKNIQHKSTFEGIEYYYPSGTTRRSKNIFIRFYHFLSGTINASILLIRENQRKKIDFILVGVLPFIIYTWFFVLCKILKVKYIQERSEYPFIKSRKSLFDPITLNIYLRLVCKYFDAFIVITNNLRDYFKPHLRKNCPVFKLPILVESERFSVHSDSPDGKYIAYCGSMQGNKDGIPDLIEAFGMLSVEYPEIKLFLIGSTDFGEFQKLKSRITELSLDDRIVFTGKIDRDELPSILANAMILVLARPESRQAEGGFPTKLGEYLATGKPVLVTDVGEITGYLKDGINAYIAPPGNPGQFAAKMKFILEHYDQALIVGAEGRNLAQSVFNYKYQGKLLNAWLNEILTIYG